MLRRPVKTTIIVAPSPFSENGLSRPPQQIQALFPYPFSLIQAWSHNYVKPSQAKGAALALWSCVENCRKTGHCLPDRACCFLVHVQCLKIVSQSLVWGVIHAVALGLLNWLTWRDLDMDDLWALPMHHHPHPSQLFIQGTSGDTDKCSGFIYLFTYLFFVRLIDRSTDKAVLLHETGGTLRGMLPFWFHRFHL